MLTALICATGMWAEPVATVTAEAVCYYQPTQIVNGDFDDDPQYSSTPKGTNQGWNTTDNGFEYSCGHNGWCAPEWYDNDGGNCYVEMNYQNAAVLYQDLFTNGGDVIRWSLDHAARTANGGDQVQDMRVEVGAPNYSGSEIIYPHGTNTNLHTEINDNTKATYRSSGITNPSAADYGFEGHNLGYLSLDRDAQGNAWYNVTGVYVIPEGQAVTRFAFVSEDTYQPDCGNFLDNITFSTLIGDLTATYGPEESVIIKGYWGDEDDTKSLKIEVGSQVFTIPMAGMAGQCFRITLPHSLLGSLPTEVTVYHEDYPSANRTIPVNYPMTVSATGVYVDFDGNPHSITVNVTEPTDGYAVTYGSSYGGCKLTENPAYTNKGTYDVYYQVSKPGYTSVKGMATVQIDAVMLNLTVLTNDASLGSTLMDDVLFEDDFSSTSSLPDGWTTSGPAWSVSDGMLKSGAADGQTSELRAQYTLSGAGSISFRYRISSEEDFDFGYFSIDGSTKINDISGNGSWQTFSQDLAAGTHTFRWWYSKDGSYGGGEDAFFIDDISITSLAPTGTDPIAIESGSTVTLVAQPNTGFTFANWTDADNNQIGTNATLTFTMDAARTVKANFVDVLYDDDTNMPAILTALDDATARTVTIKRLLLRNGDYNTLCLPFDLSTAQLQESTNPLYNFTISELTKMWVAGNELRLLMEPVSAIEAGKPYLAKYNGEADNLTQLVFNDVTVTATAGEETVVNGATMYGVLEPTHLVVDNHNYLFMTAGNTLKWPNVDNAMKSFRAYFVIADSDPNHAPVYRGMPARIVEREEVATDIENLQGNEQQTIKVLEDGVLYIIRGEHVYNAQGQLVK